MFSLYLGSLPCRRLPCGSVVKDARGAVACILCDPGGARPPSGSSASTAGFPRVVERVVAPRERQRNRDRVIEWREVCLDPLLSKLALRD